MILIPPAQWSRYIYAGEYRKELPSHVVAAGNPCKVLHEENERDKEFYFKDRRIEEELKATIK